MPIAPCAQAPCGLWGLTMNLIFWLAQFAYFLKLMPLLPQAALTFATQNCWETISLKQKMSHRSLVTLIISPVHFMLMSQWLIQRDNKCAAGNKKLSKIRFRNLPWRFLLDWILFTVLLDDRNMDKGYDISLKHCPSIHVSLPLLLPIRQHLGSNDRITLSILVEGQKTYKHRQVGVWL